jgi:hypothetical protein
VNLSWCKTKGWTEERTVKKKIIGRAEEKEVRNAVIAEHQYQNSVSELLGSAHLMGLDGRLSWI